GPTAYADMSHGYRDLLIHELTHVWQYYHDYDVIIPSAWAQLRNGASAYTYDLHSKDCWNDFNVEQQAKIVEKWFTAGLSASDLRYPFIEMIIRPGIDHRSLELDKTSGKAFVYAPLEDLRRSLMSRSGS